VPELKTWLKEHGTGVKGLSARPALPGDETSLLKTFFFFESYLLEIGMRVLHTEELKQAKRGGRKDRGRAMRVRLSTLAAAIFCAGFAVAAHAEETQCTGTIGAVRVDVFVPDGRACTLNRTRLNGNIVVGRGSQLTAQGVSVNGSVQAEGAAKRCPT